jgi:xylose isomerase
VEVAAAAGMLGSIDANSGDALLGWDTDQFNTDVKELTLAMVPILKAGGLSKGGFNFDAKLRRQSIDVKDLFYAHIGGMDAYALAFKIAHKIIQDGTFANIVKERYASFDTGYGRDIEKKKLGLKDLEKLVLTQLGEPKPVSGRQEYLENLLNTYLH